MATLIAQSTASARRPPGLATLHKAVRGVMAQARAEAYRTVNQVTMHAYWKVGLLIVEHELKGRARAPDGDAVLGELSRRLTDEFGSGFDERNLRYRRQFYLAFPAEATRPIRNAVRSESALSVADLRAELSWTHYRLLLREEGLIASHCMP